MSAYEKLALKWQAGHSADKISRKGGIFSQTQNNHFLMLLKKIIFQLTFTFITFFQFNKQFNFCTIFYFDLSPGFHVYFNP